MSDQKLCTILNGILDISTYGINISMDEASRTFGLGSEHQISISRQKIKEFNSSIEGLFNSIPAAEVTISETRLMDELIPAIRQKKIEQLRFTLADCHAFRQKISSLPIVKYRVLRDIYGIALPQNTAPLHIAVFTIYDLKSHLNQITKDIPAISVYKFKKPIGYLIECAVEARDEGKAVELADALFHRFELIIRFFIGRRTDRFEVGVLNYVGPKMKDHIVISEKSVIEGGAWQGALESIPLADSFFSNPTPPFAKLLQLIAEQSNQFERHIVRCAEWTAQAMSDHNAASAFVKAAIALEVLFSVTEKAVITPSIMSQIAESSAFLLGDSAASALEIEREVKRLYGIRSAIVHSGKDSVASSDLDAFIQICRNLVLVLLSNGKLKDIVSMEKLAEHLRTKKYAAIKPDVDDK
jgi:hypothetical protein